MRFLPVAMLAVGQVLLLGSCGDDAAERAAAAERRARDAEAKAAALETQRKADQAAAERAAQEASAAATADAERSARQQSVRVVDSGCKYNQVLAGDDYLTIKCLVENKGRKVQAASVQGTMTRYRKPEVRRIETVALQPKETKEVVIKFPEAGVEDEGLRCACEIVAE